jgi:hypothetical protein
VDVRALRPRSCDDRDHGGDHGSQNGATELTEETDPRSSRLSIRRGRATRATEGGISRNTQARRSLVLACSARSRPPSSRPSRPAPRRIPSRLNAASSDPFPSLSSLLRFEIRGLDGLVVSMASWSRWPHGLDGLMVSMASWSRCPSWPRCPRPGRQLRSMSSRGQEVEQDGDHRVEERELDASSQLSDGLRDRLMAGSRQPEPRRDG